MKLRNGAVYRFSLSTCVFCQDFIHPHFYNLELLVRHRFCEFFRKSVRTCAYAWFHTHGDIFLNLLAGDFSSQTSSPLNPSTPRAVCVCVCVCVRIHTHTPRTLPPPSKNKENTNNTSVSFSYPNAQRDLKCFKEYQPSARKIIIVSCDLVIRCIVLKYHKPLGFCTCTDPSNFWWDRGLTWILIDGFPHTYVNCTHTYNCTCLHISPYSSSMITVYINRILQMIFFLIWFWNPEFITVAWDLRDCPGPLPT